jgi:chromate reductase, NAD(P)H dehydrogenase (quinone)
MIPWRVGSAMIEGMTVLAFAGSLRRASYNRALLAAARDLAPAGMAIELYDLAALPMYNEDLEVDPPAAARDLRGQVRAADALLFATPEYNYSISGVLKNAIDWGSQPMGANVWDGKPAGILGVSVSSIGTARAQLHLRQCLSCLNVAVMPTPELLIGRAAEKFDAAGLVDEATRGSFREFLAAFDRWTRRFV